MPNQVVTELLEKAMAVARVLPAEMQDEIARVMLALARDDAVDALLPDEAAEQALADAEEARAEYATDEEVRAIWAMHGL